MAFTSISSSLYNVGKPIIKNLFTLIKTNLDDLDTRVSAVEIGSAKINVFDFTIINAASASTMTGIAYFRATQNFTLTGAELQTFEHGSLTGTLEVDCKVNSTPDDTGMTSVFTTLPSIAMAAADYTVSINQVFDGGQISISSGDIIRLDVTSMPTGGTLGKFRFQLYGEVS
jgi:hypothetical protein